MIKTGILYLFVLFLVYPLVAVCFPDETYTFVYCSGMVGMLLCAWLCLRQDIKFSWIEILLTALLLYNLPGILKYHYLAETTLFFSVYVISKRMALSANGERLVPTLFLCAGIEQIILGSMQYAGCMESFNHYFPVTGSFDNPGILGGFLAVCLSAWMGRSTTGKKDLWRIGVLFLLGFGVAFSNSRAAWLASCVALFYVIRYRFHLTWRHYACATGLFGLLFLSFSLWIYKPVSARGRILIWQVCGEMFKEHPFTGTGFGTFASEYMPHQAAFIENTGNEIITNILGNNCYAFNELLHITCEQGCLGLGLVLFLLFCLFLPSSTDRSLSSRSALLAFLTFAFFSYPCSVLLLSLQLAVMVGTLAASCSPLAISANSHRFKNVVAGIMMVVTVSLTGVLSRNFLFRCRMERALDHYIYKVDIEELSYIQSHYDRFDYSRGFIFRYARVLFLTNDYELAIPALKRAILLYPTTDKYCDLGRMYEAKGEWMLAEDSYLHALNMLPHLIYPRYCLFMLYRGQKNATQASHMAKSILSASPKGMNETILFWKRQAANYLFSEEHP